MEIVHKRTYLADRTTGTLEIACQTLGATLEDIGRPTGIKIQNETCIPEGIYQAKMTFSPHFNRVMIQLFTNPQTLACEMENIVFTGVRVHHGTTTAQTEGCVLFQGDLEDLERRVKVCDSINETVTWRICRQ